MWGLLSWNHHPQPTTPVYRILSYRIAAFFLSSAFLSFFFSRTFLISVRTFNRARLYYVVGRRKQSLSTEPQACSSIFAAKKASSFRITCFVYSHLDLFSIFFPPFFLLFVLCAFSLYMPASWYPSSTALSPLINYLSVVFPWKNACLSTFPSCVFYLRNLRIISLFWW